MNEQLSMFLKEIENEDYAEKYRRWAEYLRVEGQSDNYLQVLGIFLEYFPFNCHYWTEYIQLTRFEEYHIALKRNPKSYELWTAYLLTCKSMFYEQDKQKYKKELENAIMEVGADSRALPLYQEYYEMISEATRYQFYKKLFTRALTGLEHMHTNFLTWFESLQEEQLTALAIKEFRASADKLTPEEQKTHLKDLITDIYRKTLGYRHKRLKLEGQITRLYFDGSPAIEADKPIWRELIVLERENGYVQNISYVYERSLMAQTDDVELWEEVFHYMENETNKYTKVLNILRNNKLFFMKFQLSLYFYWCDLEERESVHAARRMYEELVKTNGSFEIYERWVQLEVRDKQWNNAKKIYDDILIVFQNDVEMLCYILVEYSEFVVRYYKEHEYSKKLLKTYFDHLPFNHYLFTKYLEFMKNFENKEGFYEELMQFILEALTKARKSLNDQELTNLTKIIKFYLRSTLSSIYLIKISEHKMLEVEERLTKGS